MLFNIRTRIKYFPEKIKVGKVSQLKWETFSSENQKCLKPLSAGDAALATVSLGKSPLG